MALPTDGPRPPEAWCLTVVYHPDLQRIGAQHRWTTEPGGYVELSRLAPAFSLLHDRRALPLGEPHLSRSPLLLRNTIDGLLILPESDRVLYELNGRPGGPQELLPLAMLDRGVVITLGQRVSLMLHGSELRPRGWGDVGLIGVSEAVSRVRDEIERLAPLDVPVLLTGESGVGKELVARALHQRSPRASRKLIPVNMAALPPPTAAAELFGHSRGAYTGAAEARAGLFGEAAGGTLFLDEIGETPLEVQPMLLRAIEFHEIQPLGLAPQRIDVRVVAATDADLEKLAGAGRFRRPLLYRLSAANIVIPPLREHPVDIPVLLMHFLRLALTDLNAAGRLASVEGQQPWLRKQDVLALLRYNWPGNVRELRNVAFQMALECHGRPVASLAASLMERLARSEQTWQGRAGRGGTPGPPELMAGSMGTDPVGSSLPFGIAASGGLRSERVGEMNGTRERGGRSSLAQPIRPADIEEAMLRSALEANGWRIGATAEFFGISRNSLYALMEQFAIRHAGVLSREEILAAAQAEASGDLERIAERLRVSPRGLKLRMRVLGLEW